MSWPVNSKDADIKKFLSLHLPPLKKSRAKADYEFDLNGQEIWIEYENSSRGLAHNLLKLSLYAEGRNGIAVMIRTKNHEKKHHADWSRSLYLADKLKSSSFKILMLRESDIKGPAHLMAIIKSVSRV